MTHASVFSGIGGPEVAATMLGWENLFHCEINPFGKAVLDYWYPNAKSYEDITTTDFSEWRGKVNVLTGGFPCQPFSYAGQRRGAQDDRYLWPYMFRCIDQVRPDWVVAENVAGILTMVEQGEVSKVAGSADLFDEEDRLQRYRLSETFTLQRICDDLESHGYSVQPILIPACAVGAPHRRDRVFIVGCRNKGLDECKRRRTTTNTESNGGGRSTWSKSCEDKRPDRAQNGESAIGSSIRTAECLTSNTIGSGEGTPRTSGSPESIGSDQDKQSELWGAETEWNNRFYAILRHATDTNHQSWGVNSYSECIRWFEGQYDNGFSDVAQQTECGEIQSCRTNCTQNRWRNFPTVSPVHRGNDGLPFSLDDLTLSSGKWRTEALKAYGNAIVPQVMYEIFRAIELTYED